MLTALMMLLRSIGLIYCGHQAIALEDLALRQQLAAVLRTDQLITTCCSQIATLLNIRISKCTADGIPAEAGHDSP